MMSPAVIGGILSTFLAVAVISKEYRNHVNEKKSRHDDLEYRRRRIRRRR